MISVSEALQIVLSDVPSTGTELVALPHARGRVLAEPVVSQRDVPGFANSAMDGFAVRAEDLAAPTIRLRVVETIPAGVVPKIEVISGTAAKIMTGSVLPAGADTVVKVEDSTEADGYVTLDTKVRAGANIRQAGEDVRRGQAVFDAGQALRPADLGVLASIGATMLRVHRLPRVTILSTGDELVDLGQPVGPGQIVNSNAYTLAAAVEEAGALPIVGGIVRDDREATEIAFRRALEADIVLSTGGVSMGVFDLVREILAGIGVEEKFWKIAQKPGKPMTFGRRGEKHVFGLPGNPVSALVCFYLYVFPVIRKMLGLRAIHLPSLQARAGEDLSGSQGLTDFLRCSLRDEAGELTVHSTGTQSSGVLRSMSLGQGLIVLGPECPGAKKGTRVQVIRFADEMSVTAPI